KQELLEQAQSIAHIGSWRFDINFENIICSNEIYNIFELDINEPLSYQKLISCIHEEDKQNVINTHLSAITNKTNYSIKYRIKKNENNIKYVNEIGRFNKAENIDFLSGTVQDITEFTQMQEQLIHSEKLSVTGQLAAGIAHEFNNILSILKSNIQYLEMKLSKNNAEQEIVELYKIFIEQIDRAANIVKQLMLFSRPKPPQKKNVNVNEVIEEILKLQNKQLEFENIKISKQYSNDDVYICCDDGQLQQVLMNLIINARHAILAASKNNGEIKIIIEKINGKVIIKIIDNGIGIPQNVQDKIFTPFFSTKGAYIKDINQPKIKGTGLGLAISKKIIENNDGKISFVSKENVGTEFILEFNALLENKDNLPQKKNITKKDDLPNNTPILFIDDEQTLLQLISKNLKNKGYTNIYIATNADIATVLVKTINLKFIFLDIMMPFVDGYKLLKKLQNINAESDYYFMTGNLDVDVSMIDEYKVQGILQKPIDIEKIIEIINSKK
ncbi:MAG TPA: ATP-binding protein, partial [bacterium]|nr:ATP-binding protein [bacterium]